MTDRDTLDVLRRAAVWFEANPDGFEPLLDAIGDARLVLIGEASHGTHEFYRTRAELTKALVVRKGFNSTRSCTSTKRTRSSRSKHGLSMKRTCRRRILQRCRCVPWPDAPDPRHSEARSTESFRRNAG
jgi:hypothetical protein